MVVRIAAYHANSTVPFRRTKSRVLSPEDKAFNRQLVCDNLNTHTLGALYERFEPCLARSLARRLEFVYTPKHGSWLNIAENELSALTVQCIKECRFGTIEELRAAVQAWAQECNAKRKGVHWQFNTEDARIKLIAIYPKFVG